MMYTISKDKNGEWYAHKKGFAYVPVFASFGSKAKAQAYADMYNLRPFNKNLVYEKVVENNV